MKPAPRVCTRKPEGGDHDPSGRRATTTPEPPAPEMCKPVRKVVKTASPAAVSMALWGILTRTLGLPFGPGEPGVVEEEEEEAEEEVAVAALSSV
jgi:hypothetical protein